MKPASTSSETSFSLGGGGWRVRGRCDGGCGFSPGKHTGCARDRGRPVCLAPATAALGLAARTAVGATRAGAGRVGTRRRLPGRCKGTHRGHERDGLERLPRYRARPAFALERLREIDSEHVVYENIKPGPGGSPAPESYLPVRLEVAREADQANLPPEPPLTDNPALQSRIRRVCRREWRKSWA